MMIIEIEYTYPLDFEDVMQFLPFLTTDNGVFTDERILHLEITTTAQKTLRLFIDFKTKEYCFDGSRLNEDYSDLLYEIGDIVISKIHRFKLNRYEIDFEGLVGYIKKHITACEVAA